MEENKDNNQINDEEGIAASENIAGSENPQVNLTANNLEPLPKKSKKKLLIVILIILLILIAGAISAYFILKDDSSEDSMTPIMSEISEETSDEQTKLFMQFDQKIIAYDTVTKQSSVITDKVPEESTVIDFYYGSDDEWRYYADDFNKIYFSDESSNPKVVADAAQYVVANAEKRIFAYEEVGALKNSASKTYLSTDNDKPELVYESRKNDYDPDKEISSDPKSFLYVIRDISSSGDELLYQQNPCFECGGIGLRPYFNSFKLNLKTKKTEVINKSGEGAQPFYFNDDDQVILIKDKTTGFGSSNLSLNVTTYLFDKNAGLSEIFKINDNKTLSYSLSHNGDFATTQLKGKNYNNEESNILPGELYYLDGNKTETLKSNLERYEYILGSSAGDCVAAGFEDRALINDDFVYKYSVGVICKDDSGVYTYNALENVTNSGDSAEEVIYRLL